MAEMNIEGELLACPFCGVTPEVRGRDAPYPPAYGVGCDHVGCLLSVWSRWYRTKAEAVVAWNTRAPPSPSTSPDEQGEG